MCQIFCQLARLNYLTFFSFFLFYLYISVQINSDQLIDLHKINNKNINVNLCKQRDKILYSAIVSIFVTIRRGKKNNNLFSNYYNWMKWLKKRTPALWFDLIFTFLLIFFNTRKYFDGHIETLLFILLIINFCFYGIAHM